MKAFPGKLRFSTALICSYLFSYSLWSAEVDSAITLEVRSFPNIDNQPASFDDHYSVDFETEIQGSTNNGNTIFTFTPFGRWDSEDNAREHFDIRELNFLHSSGDWETLIGISKVFWGVAESNHLIDIINQTDFLEGIDEEDKLGQPMIRLSRSFDQSTLTGFILPGFREREFLSPDNPISLPFKINNDPIYESNQEDNHVDFALRYSGYRGIVDYGLSWFHGTARDPNFIPGESGIFTPFYPQLDQFGIDIQVTSGAWLWKFEAIRQVFNDDTLFTNEDYNAFVAGFEYSFYGMADGAFDLGLLMEYHYDSRDDPGAVVFQDDVFLGARLGFNDAQSSQILIGGIIDQDDDSTSFRIEGSRRIFTDARISLEAQAFSNVDPDNISASLRDSEFALISLEFFF